MTNLSWKDQQFLQKTGERVAHPVPSSSQDAESKEHGCDADEQLQNQENHQSPQDSINQQLWKQQKVRKQEVKVIQSFHTEKGGECRGGGAGNRNFSSRFVSAGTTYFTLLLDQPGAFPETMLLQWTVKREEKPLSLVRSHSQRAAGRNGNLSAAPRSRSSSSAVCTGNECVCAHVRTHSCSGPVRQVPDAGETPEMTPGQHQKSPDLLHSSSAERRS